MGTVTALLRGCQSHSFFHSPAMAGVAARQGCGGRGGLCASLGGSGRTPGLSACPTYVGWGETSLPIPLKPCCSPDAKSEPPSPTTGTELRSRSNLRVTSVLFS